MNLFSVLILSDRVVSWSCKHWGSEPCVHGKDGSHQPYSSADFMWTLMALASLSGTALCCTTPGGQSNWQPKMQVPGKMKTTTVMTVTTVTRVGGARKQWAGLTSECLFALQAHWSISVTEDSPQVPEFQAWSLGAAVDHPVTAISSTPTWAPFPRDQQAGCTVSLSKDGGLCLS